MQIQNVVIGSIVSHTAMAVFGDKLTHALAVLMSYVYTQNVYVFSYIVPPCLTNFQTRYSPASGWVRSWFLKIIFVWISVYMYLRARVVCACVGVGVWLMV